MARCWIPLVPPEHPLLLYNFANLGSLSSLRNCLKYSIDSGFDTVLLGLTSLPLIVCLTAASTFLPFMVVGIPFSGTSMMKRGTCRGDRPARMVCLIEFDNSDVNLCPGIMTRNRKTSSSLS